jgi:uncharacterized protein (DUF2461 family)
MVGPPLEAGDGMSAHGNGFTESSFRFLSDLAENNDAEWFRAHRGTFERAVDEPFVALLEEVTAGWPAPLCLCAAGRGRRSA